MKHSNRGSEWRRWDLHLHTASSYDRDYGGEDYDEILVSNLRENEVAAVAITDHFKIDADRIINLRRLAPEIIFFPGVELRIDTLGTNTHVILIFSEEFDLKTLEEDFNSIMYRDKGKSPEDDKTIYWHFEDVVEFARKREALISIHAGTKSNGIDKITNAIEVAQAVKREVGKDIDFFEIGKIDDIESYENKVFKHIARKPLILCSDNHDPRNYFVKEKLWIKADTTFNGLVQTIYQPEERVFIGELPPDLEKVHNNKKNYIDSIKIMKVEEPKNEDYTWFDCDIPINKGLTAIIGNKGSGKSALSDIIGHLCKCKGMSHASFLNKERFRKPPKNYADDYVGVLRWLDGHEDVGMNLGIDEYDTSIENAQYLPQKYIEEVCNSLDDEFKNEINKLIFSYVDSTEKGDSRDLEELIKNKSIGLSVSIERLKQDLSEINKEIIELESKQTKNYIKELKDNYDKLQELLERHLKIKPEKVDKPNDKLSEKEEKNLSYCNDEIIRIENIIKIKKEELTSTNMNIDWLINIKEQVKELINTINDLNLELREIEDNIEIEKIQIETNIDRSKKILVEKIKSLELKRDSLRKEIGIDVDDEIKDSLYNQLERKKKEKREITSLASNKQKEYQKYLDEIKTWEETQDKLIGDINKKNTLKFIESEIAYVENKLLSEYEDKKHERLNVIKEIYKKKQEIASIYLGIYKPIELQLKSTTDMAKETINFEVNISLSNLNIGNNLLSNINRNYSGVFYGKSKSESVMDELIRETDFNNMESTLLFISKILKVVDENIDESINKIKDKEYFYNTLCQLDYINPEYNLKMNGRSLEELSPGERGIALLFFYLSLSKNDIPIIIDQPEDNLDNQSVYSNLVSCILSAKKKRQVIIVTHNPNIAIACDAEQIICCSINKSNNKIDYYSGSIENPEIRDKVIDILEGTKPAFDLRKRKYSM